MIVDNYRTIVKRSLSILSQKIRKIKRALIPPAGFCPVDNMNYNS